MAARSSPNRAMKVTAMPDNSLLIGKTRYIEVAHNLFRETNDYGRIAFQENETGEVTGFVIDGTGVMQLYKAPFYETADFFTLLIGLSGAVFIGVFLRLAYQWGRVKALSKPEKSAFYASIIVASCNILFFCIVALGVSGGQQALMYELSNSLKVAPIFSTLAALTAFYHLYCSVQVWHQKLYGTIFARIRFSVVSICALLMAWFYYTWNFTGLNYFS